MSPKTIIVSLVMFFVAASLHGCGGCEFTSGTTTCTIEDLSSGCCDAMKAADATKIVADCSNADDQAAYVEYGKNAAKYCK